MVDQAAGIYLFKVNNGNTRKMYEIYIFKVNNKDTRTSLTSGVFILNSE